MLTSTKPFSIREMISAVAAAGLPVVSSASAAVLLAANEVAKTKMSAAILSRFMMYAFYEK
ncbi:hypothetical protein [Methylomonas sp. CM2]|uniref:hypothetical protein n=1 Tax=Methylomonas sp. CM2 TaxID=3417647 RepID=UPI003CEB5800